MNFAFFSSSLFYTVALILVLTGPLNHLWSLFLYHVVVDASLRRDALNLKRQLGALKTNWIGLVTGYFITGAIAAAAYAAMVLFDWTAYAGYVVATLMLISAIYLAAITRWAAGVHRQVSLISAS